jgi:hypothetical protein
MITGMREVGIYQGSQLVLTVADRPGRLYSTAAPPPDGAPDHPFVDARAYDALSENDLGMLLQQATDYDGFLALLIDAGFDVATVDDIELATASRLVRDGAVVGALWEQPGPVGALGEEPAGGWTTSAVATITAYDDHAPPELEREATAATDVADLRQRLEALGYQLD